MDVSIVVSGTTSASLVLVKSIDIVCSHPDAVCFTGFLYQGTHSNYAEEKPGVCTAVHLQVACARFPVADGGCSSYRVRVDAVDGITEHEAIRTR